MANGIQWHQHAEGLSIVSPDGDLDLSNAHELRECIKQALAATNQGVIVDMSNVTLMDSATIGVLLGGMRRAGEKGVKFALAGLRPTERRTITMTRLEGVFTIYDDLEQAIAQMRGEKEGDDL